MKETTTIVIILLLLFFQWGQLPTYYANELEMVEGGRVDDFEMNTRNDIGDNEDTNLSNNLSVFNTREFYAEPNDTGMTLVSYLGAGGHVDIPAVIEGKPVTAIGEYAFYNKKVTSVTIPDSVTKIGDGAFHMNQLTTVAIPNSVTSIGKLAFYLNQLTTVAIPNSVKNIGEEAFAINQLTTVTLPNGITSIEKAVFRNNQFESITIPNSVTSIGNYAFYQNPLKNIILSDSLTSIGDYAFYENQLASVEIPDDVIYIGQMAFYMNRLTTIAIPSGLTNISTGAFQNNRLTYLHIPDNITSIGNWAFLGNYLKNVYISNRVTDIGDWAFAKNQLINLDIPETVTHIGDWAFESNQLQWVRFNSPLMLETNTFINQGSTFDGWYKDLSWVTQWDGNVTQPIRIYGKGNVVQYTLTFETNNGTNIDEQKIVAGEKAVVPVTPVKTGYLFAGWYKDEEFNTPWGFTTNVIIENTTLYAKWSKRIYDVQYHTDRESFLTHAQYEDKLKEPVTPTRVGYTFVGWYKEREFKTPWNFATDVVTEDIILYAKWTANEYTVNFHTNGGTAISPVTVMYDKLLNEPVKQTKAGHIFAGWYKDEEFKTPWNFATDRVTEDVTLYAKWELAQTKYTLDFNTSGGSTVPSQRIIGYTTATKPANPTKSGYTFAGWYKDVNFAEPWDFNTDVLTANITLYAKWLENGSSGDGGSTYPIPTPIPENLHPNPESSQREKPDRVPVEPVEPQPPKSTPKPEEDIIFSDVFRDHWAWTMIQAMAKRSIITGYQDGTFKPNAPIQRQHVALMLARALELEQKKEEVAFNDIPKSHLYFEVITQVQQAGLFDGIDGNFLPRANMTRAQMAKVLVLAFNLTSTEKETFHDVPETHWAYDYIAILAAKGIVLGNQGNFRPNDPVTRAEFATLLYRALHQ